MKVDYLKIIKSTLKSHKIAKNHSISIESFERNKNYPYSEGIEFESKTFFGKIFMYFGTMKYLEIEFVIFKTGSDYTLIKDDLNTTELIDAIDQFLTERTIELKNVA